jgi:hypothetical protein
VSDDDLVLRFETQTQLVLEYAQNLSHGRAFVSGATTLPLFSHNVLVLEHTPSHACFEVAVEVVMVMAEGPLLGSALQFLDRSQEALDALAQFVNSLDESSLHSSAPPPEHEMSDAATDETASMVEAEPSEDEPLADGRSLRPSLSQQRQMKLRELTPAERLKVARSPSLEERTLLERIYGNAVWDSLLRNPKITVPEVARLARKGTMPRTLLELIVENDHWIRQSVVRRGLLANPRLSPEGVAKVLRTMSPRELKLIPQQTAYPAQVRAVAQRLMRGT